MNKKSHSRMTGIALAQASYRRKQGFLALHAAHAAAQATKADAVRKMSADKAERLLNSGRFERRMAAYQPPIYRSFLLFAAMLACVAGAWMHL